MRGLKLYPSNPAIMLSASHLLQMRGLKPNANSFYNIDSGSHLLQMRGLKLFAHPLSGMSKKVASFTDAWIETYTRAGQTNILESHLLQMRGLKRCAISRVASTALSHLLQMRGLKP